MKVAVFCRYLFKGIRFATISQTTTSFYFHPWLMDRLGRCFRLGCDDCDSCVGSHHAQEKDVRGNFNRFSFPVNSF